MNPAGTSDVVIIGAGPAGLAAGVYTGRARLSTIILEKMIPGGQTLLTNWIENYPGFPEGVAPFELVELFRKQAERFGAVIETEDVTGLRREAGLWRVAGREREFAARAVIIATGARASAPPIAGLDQVEYLTNEYGYKSEYFDREHQTEMKSRMTQRAQERAETQARMGDARERLEKTMVVHRV